MLVTLIVRLLPERLAEGELVGEVEHVYSGEQVVVRDLGELAGFAHEAAAREAVDGRVPRVARASASPAADRAARVRRCAAARRGTAASRC